MLDVWTALLPGVSYLDVSYVYVSTPYKVILLPQPRVLTAVVVVSRTIAVSEAN